MKTGTTTLAISSTFQVGMPVSLTTESGCELCVLNQGGELVVTEQSAFEPTNIFNACDDEDSRAVIIDMDGKTCEFILNMQAAGFSAERIVELIYQIVERMCEKIRTNPIEYVKDELSRYCGGFGLDAAATGGLGLAHAVQEYCMQEGIEFDVE